jgi:osmotically-inducible protein OsmY
MQASKMVSNNVTALFLLLSALILVQGCAGVVLGGAATSAVMVNDPRTTGTVIEDQSIEVKAVAVLRQDADIKDQAHYSVTSYNQIVLLAGQAPTVAMRRRMAELVATVEKVRHIHNEVAVSAPSSMMMRTNDAVLTTKVKGKLFANDQLSATRIKVVSEDGVVYLLGLANQADADLAADIASTTSGTKKVVKLFEVQ